MAFDEDTFEDANKNQDSDTEETPEEDVVNEIEEPEPPPKPPDFVKPRKRDSAKYFIKQSDSWRTATILSFIRRYGGDWYNIERRWRATQYISIQRLAIEVYG